MSDHSLPADAAAQLIALEEKVTFQQRLLEELNEVVLSQQTELKTQRKELAACRTMIEELVEQGVSGDLPHEKPPHY